MLKRWRDVTSAIKNKRTQPKLYRQFFIGHLYQDDLLREYQRQKTVSKKNRTIRNYYLEEPFHHIYFTQRELDCLQLLLQGKTNRYVADQLALSERTVEFYIRNMREKTGTTSKQALLEFMSKMNIYEKKSDKKFTILALSLPKT